MKTQEDWSRICENSVWIYKDIINDITKDQDERNKEILYCLLRSLFHRGTLAGIDDVLENHQSIKKDLM